MTTADDDDGINPATAALAEQVIREAAGLPGAGEIHNMAEEAIRHGGSPGMSTEEIRKLADKAIERAEQVTSLLRRLSSLLGDSPGDTQDGGSR